MAMRTRADHYGGVDTGVHAEELARTSRLVSRLTGYPVQYNKAVVGRNAFAHESGIHQHGVLTERQHLRDHGPRGRRRRRDADRAGQALGSPRVRRHARRRWAHDRRATR